MEKIASFTVDHTKLMPGIYTSRIDCGITTYDIRMRRPNVEEPMDNASIHTIEHLFATCARNSEFRDEVIYFGPMGCRTGFYFLVRNISQDDTIKLINDCFKFILGFEGEIPGASASECGNYREHSLDGAKKEAEKFLKVIGNWTKEQLEY